MKKFEAKAIGMKIPISILTSMLVGGKIMCFFI